MKQINIQNNLRRKFIKKGVKMIAPETVFFSRDTKIGKNVSIEPYVVIGKKVRIQNFSDGYFSRGSRKARRKQVN